MKTIKITKGQTVLVDDADFDYLSKWNWYAERGKNDTFYASRGEYYKNPEGIKKHRIIKMHRQILGLYDPSILVDHIDKDGLNNCRQNLRQCNVVQNNINRRYYKESTSIFRGVCLKATAKKKRWRCNISIDSRYIYLGSYTTEIEAAMAYNEAAIKYHGEFANLNIIPSCVV